MGKVRCPTLLLHGTADSQVLAATNLTALEKGFKGNKQATFQRLDAATHDFQTALGERALLAGATSPTAASANALDAVGEWVAKRMK